jgi:hypothetical protein
MEIKTSQIELFKNIIQGDFDGNYYDLHNDFNCIKITIEKGVLSLIFRNIHSSFLISLKFLNVNITFFEFDLKEKIETLTIDNLYRGRFEVDEKLIEYKNEDGYFYLEFYEGQKMEFWSKSLIVKRE